MTAPSTMGPVQRALYSALSEDATLTALITGVYDFVPEPSPFPYIAIGEATEVPDNAHGRFGRQTVVTLHVWTRARGHTVGLAIGARVTALLDHQPLTVEGQHHVVTRFEFSQTLTDPEPPGDIRHLVLRYRVVTEQPT
ncbi:DUF3168 domain-containing protein [Streptomyces sp. E5N91]|uniref:DUF3168 domain-containing protein n=1 Tax=Streptomyces sp. E5N91 TaxID=1851996 RepID=UPI001EE7B260|nr:DUF3168 domain-containing protein [Streptomyces sp. E5N91]